MAADEGSGSPKKKEMTWMYGEADKILDRDKYLTGAKIDKNFELFGSDGQKQSFGNIDSLISKAAEKHHRPKAGSSMLDLETVRKEDPLVAIKMREQKVKQEVLSNPVKMKKLQKLVMTAMQDKMKEALKDEYKNYKKQMKKEKKKKRKKDKKQRDGSASSEEDSGKDESRRNQSPERRDRKRNEERRERERSQQDSRSRQRRSSRSRSPIDRSHRAQPARPSSRSRSPDRRRNTDRHSRDHAANSRRRESGSPDRREHRREDEHRRRSRSNSPRPTTSDRRGHESNTIPRERPANKDIDTTRERSRPSKSSTSASKSADRRQSPPNQRSPKSKASTTSRRRRSRSVDSDGNDRDAIEKRHKTAELISGKSEESSRKSEKPKKRTPSPTHSDSDEEQRKLNYARSYGLVKMKKDDSPPAADGEERSPVKLPTYYKFYEKPKLSSTGPSEKRQKPLTAEEKAAKLAEMTGNAKWREEQRDRNLKMFADIEKTEKERNERGQKKEGSDFIRPMLAASTDTDSMEERLKRKKGNLQRSHGAMERSFTKR